MSYNESEVERIYDRASQIETPDERIAYLAEACAGRDELRQRVDQLLQAADHLGSFLEQDVAAAVLTVDQPVTEHPGMMIGPYRLLEEIGEGGFGLVFVAEQHEPFHRRVALKVIKPGMDSREVIARFEAERQALALMDHPNIARVIDAGTTDAGRPYFVMELVKGIPVTKYCDQALLTLRERLSLFIDLCRAVQHAHQKGIIHRDIKPSNVLVTLHDGEPMVKIIDFGVAKALDRQLSDHTVYTRFHEMIGTPMYMSPEQTGMSNLDVDTRSDIYSLGVLLYELLTGNTPFEREQLARKALEEIQRIIREEEPPKPSTKLSHSGDRLASIAAVRRTEPAKLTKLMRGDLDWIVMRCLEKDRNRRYDTANGLLQDIERYLQDEPVEASPPSRLYRLRKFARKYRVPLTIGTTFLAVILIGAAIATWQAVRATRSEHLAEASAQRTERVLEFLISAFRKPDPAVEGREVKVADVLEQAINDAKDNLADDPLQRAAILDAIGQTLLGLGVLDQSIQSNQAALEIYRVRLGDRHPDTLATMSRLAVAHQRAGRLDRAVGLFEQVLSLRNAELGEGHRGTLQSMSDLADAYGRTGRLQESTALNEKALAALCLQLGENHPDTGGPRHRLGAAYVHAGRIRDGVTLLEENLTLTRAQRGDGHPDTLVSINTLAWAYQAAGQLDDAIPLFEEALAWQDQKLGRQHFATLSSMSNLAEAYRAAGRLNEALELGKETLELKWTHLGKDHPNTFASVNNLALTYEDVGQLDKALPLYEKGLELSRLNSGPEHPDTLASMSNLASVYSKTGKLPQALALEEEGLELSRRILGEDHPDTLISLSNLAVLYEKAGQLDKALPMYEKELELCRLKQGPDHPETLISMANVAGVYLTTGQSHKALHLAEQTLELRRAKLGDEHPETLQSLQLLGNVYLFASRLDDAINTYERAVEGRRIKLGTSHPHTVESKRSLGFARLEAGELDKALSLFNEVLEFERATPHSWTSATPLRISEIYMRTGRREEAHKLLDQILKRGREIFAETESHLAGLLQDVALVMLRGQEYDRAEKLLDECLEIRQAKQPDSWRLAEAKSMLGEALTGQERFTEAEPLLLQGFEGMQTQADRIPRPWPRHRKAAAERLVTFYMRTDRKAESGKWQEELRRIEEEIKKLAEVKFSLSAAPQVASF